MQFEFWRWLSQIVHNHWIFQKRKKIKFAKVNNFLHFSHLFVSSAKSLHKTATNWCKALMVDRSTKLLCIRVVRKIFTTNNKANCKVSTYCSKRLQFSIMIFRHSLSRIRKQKLFVPSLMYRNFSFTSCPSASVTATGKMPSKLSDGKKE